MASRWAHEIALTTFGARFGVYTVVGFFAFMFHEAEDAPIWVEIPLAAIVVFGWAVILLGPLASAVALAYALGLVPWRAREMRA